MDRLVKIKKIARTLASRNTAEDEILEQQEELGDDEEWYDMKEKRTGWYLLFTRSYFLYCEDDEEIRTSFFYDQETADEEERFESL